MGKKCKMCHMNLIIGEGALNHLAWPLATAFDAMYVRCGVDEGMHCLKGRISQSARNI